MYENFDCDSIFMHRSYIQIKTQNRYKIIFGLKLLNIL